MRFCVNSALSSKNKRRRHSKIQSRRDRHALKDVLIGEEPLLSALSMVEVEIILIKSIEIQRHVQS